MHQLPQLFIVHFNMCFIINSKTRDSIKSAPWMYRKFQKIEFKTAPFHPSITYAQNGVAKICSYDKSLLNLLHKRAYDFSYQFGGHDSTLEQKASPRW
mmetsp:Transcript_2283/g.3140  ORF Transcript_2283/g.3140 Transcript_2283/m.3140 type:complete len:98 (+) Transcript_2283:258-551(+)